MKKRTIQVSVPTTGRDMNAQLMWGNCGTRVFRDKRKILARKAKHKALAY